MKQFLLLFFSGCVLFALATNFATAQQTEEQRLAHQYYTNGEYEKAVILFEKLEADGKTNLIYSNYFKTLLALKEYAKAEALVRSQLKNRKNDVLLLIDLGLLYKAQGETAKANEQFKKALETKDVNMLNLLARTYTDNAEYDFAIEAHQKINQIDPQRGANYGYQLAGLYQKKGDDEKMIATYLEFAAVSENNLQQVKNVFQELLDKPETADELQKQLYAHIQKDPENIDYPDLLSWVFIQQKDFESALIQVKALDKRLNENGTRLLDLARLALIEREYDAAIEAYEVVVAKGANNTMYSIARSALLNARMRKIKETNTYTQQDIDTLVAQYTAYLDETGKNGNTITTLRELAQLKAFYQNDLPSAIALLESVVEMPNLNQSAKARVKLDLGDYFLMKNEVWEATLLYSQVDKALKDDVLGEEARFRNAKLSYYIGDFEWAQSQLDVLKASTSELISNDAIDLSVFITDNYGLDTTTVPMEMFARADLLLLQNQTLAATKTLDSINAAFPNHVLDDDILFKRGQIALKKQDFKTAATYFETVAEKYKTEILADNAVFALAELYELNLNDKDKARALYQSIITDFAGSLFIVEARKRFRKLRGDDIN
ncbi:MAG: tetratricopeptide repeat protein [Sphingobacteriales bacterium]|jgi:tetratricopeptide (TPR) repeat protein|nr:tetratricopeptide repeat protein [Sphingobacteriales bacterium]MBP9141220.1 tetratricopeptide repeat protein [Chitinophagales bacterium]MBK6890443.1 tetratricopeptide repeat protein [Sphingobacteriales bacterium]MBK7526505.1 tetratricopeptide repeat protein [Sphingobacteriales bacterium]MBK8679923.1 tetratricopeptide repeat protein [Sphingobacteriales bacterium]